MKIKNCEEPLFYVARIYSPTSEKFEMFFSLDSTLVNCTQIRDFLNDCAGGNAMAELIISLPSAKFGFYKPGTFPALENQEFSQIDIFDLLSKSNCVIEKDMFSEIGCLWIDSKKFFYLNFERNSGLYRTLHIPFSKIDGLEY